MQGRLLLVVLGLAALVAMLIPTAGVPAPTGKERPGPFDTRHADAVVERGVLPLNTAAPQSERSFRPGIRPFSHGDPAVGDEAVWLGLDDVAGEFILKFFTLRAVGTHGEIWVANNTNFPEGDCRNGPRTVVTDEQVASMLNEFDTNIWPKESAAFSVPPDRNGSDEIITSLVPPAIAALMHPQGAGDRVVILVDNVRDENYYDEDNANGFSYIAGFFSSQLDDLFDRNVMTIDAFDWLHRTGATPPDEPVPGDFCNSAPARPFLYEGTFAHEYQHLLEHYEDGDEANWINEGLSDWAQTLTGYVDPATPITESGFDSHVQCFLGWLGIQTPANPNPRAGGPENSLTRWGDQGQGEILCDYGAAYTLMEFLHGRYGTDFMTALHRGDASGLPGLQEALETVSKKLMAEDVLHDWALMVALDGLLDDGAALRGQVTKRRVTTPTLDATVNWATEHAYSTPGAPPNGADYVQLRDASGTPFTGSQLRTIGFEGARTLPPKPIEWVVDPDPPLEPTDPALYSGAANRRDQAIVRSVAVPAGAGAVLTFDALWNEELGWDFGFVQVSTDGGETYESIACTDTTTETNPDALPTAKENVPGFTGYSGGWRLQTCDLSAYAGQTVIVAFRAFNDPAALGETHVVPPGFWVDDVTVGGELISDGSSLDGWMSTTEVRPGIVHDFEAWLVSIDDRGDRRDVITVKRLRIRNNFTLRGSGRIRRYINRNAEFVGAIVFYDDPTETSDQYAPYRLTVNGVVQPGGGM